MAVRLMLQRHACAGCWPRAARRSAPPAPPLPAAATAACSSRAESTRGGRFTPPAPRRCLRNCCAGPMCARHCATGAVKQGRGRAAAGMPASGRRLMFLLRCPRPQPRAHLGLGQLSSDLLGTTFDYTGVLLATSPVRSGASAARRLGRQQRRGWHGTGRGLPAAPPSHALASCASLMQTATGRRSSGSSLPTPQRCSRGRSSRGSRRSRGSSSRHSRGSNRATLRSPCQDRGRQASRAASPQQARRRRQRKRARPARPLQH